MELNESLIESCKAIIESIVNEKNESNRRLKYFDFVDKFKSLNEIPIIKNQAKIKYDIIIFTIVPVEFATLNKLYNISSNGRREDHDLNGLWYYEFEINRTHQKTPLKALVTLVGVAGDVNCSLACSRAFQRFNCDLAILCGIAAGIKSEVSLYSTVVSQSIVNYEFQRIEADEITYRPIPYPIDKYNENLTSKLKLHSEEWKQNFLSTYEVLVKGKDKKEFPKEKLSHVEIKTGVIASGAKLLADGKTMEGLRKNIPIQKGIIAAEMEGSGFSPACMEYKINWLVFRGISDHGEEDKNNPMNKKYQKIAAASAITSMFYYLKYFYRTPKERGDEEYTF